MGVASSRAPTGAPYPRQRSRRTPRPGTSVPPPLVRDSSAGPDALPMPRSSLASSSLRTSERNLTPEQRIGHAAVRGTLVGYVAVTVIVTIIGLFSDAGIGPSIAIALFCAFWGGPGFGGMIGATLALTREEAREAAAEREARAVHDAG